MPGLSLIGTLPFWIAVLMIPVFVWLPAVDTQSPPAATVTSAARLKTAGASPWSAKDLPCSHLASGLRQNILGLKFELVIAPIIDMVNDGYPGGGGVRKQFFPGAEEIHSSFFITEWPISSLFGFLAFIGLLWLGKKRRGTE